MVLCLLVISVQAQDHPYYPLKEKGNQKGGEKVLSTQEKILFQKQFFNGLKQKAIGDFEGALATFQECLRIDGSQSAPMYELAQLYLRMQEPTQALFFIESAASIDEQNVWYQQLLAEVYYGNQKYGQAITTYKKLLEEQPGNEEWHFQLANSYLMDGQLRSAIRVYNEMEQYVGVNEMLSMQKHRLYLELKDKRNALKELQKWKEAEPRNPQPQAILAEFYLLEGKQLEAIKVLEEALLLDPNNGKAMLMLADLYRNQKQETAAYEMIKRSFASKQVGIDAKMRLLLSYYEKIEDTTLSKQAYELVDILLATHPDDAKPYAMSGDYLYRDNKLAEAKAAFLKALEFDKSRFPIWQQVMIIAFDLKEYEEVVTIGEEAKELFPSQGIVYLLSGMSHLQLKQYEQAIESLETGSMMIFGNPELSAQFQASIGDAYHALKNDEKSDQAYETSLSYSPHNTYVLNNYSYYLSLRGEKLDKALEMMEVCTALNPGISSYEDTYAWVFYQSKYYDKALEWIQKALASGGDNSATIVEHYGDILYQLGRTTEALTQWKLAKELGSDTPFIDQKIAEQKLYE
jgi:tetratricopeptide (TPR) repeat protein